MSTVSHILKELQKQAKAHDVEVIDRGNGHIQLKGKLLVNYYPESKKQSAYVAGTTCKKVGVSPKDAIAMCFNAPSLAPDKKDKRRQKKGHKIRLFRQKPFCFCCNKKFALLSECTVEHVIPLARGGLDNLNNKALSCPDCNHKRGHEMPELKRRSAQRKPHHRALPV